MDGLIAYALSKKYADEVGRSILDAGFKTQVEQDRSILQTTGQEKILYFIPKTTAKPSDGYDEYVYSNNAWEQVGVTDVDLSSIDYNGLQNKPQINGFDLDNRIALNRRYFTYDRSIIGDDIRYDLNLNDKNLFTHLSYLGTGLIYGHISGYIFVEDLTLEEKALLPPNIDDGTILQFIEDHSVENFYDMVGYNVLIPKNGTSIYIQTTTFNSGQIPQLQRGSWARIGDYTLTAQDKTDIANIVLNELQNADTMTFPIASEVNNS